MQAAVRIAVFALELLLAGLLVAWLRTAGRGERPPLSFLFELFSGGAAAAVLAAAVEFKYGPALTAHTLTYNLAVSLTEELGKYFVAALLILHSRHLHKLSDGIFYLIVIGLGFSLVEDALFLADPQTLAGYRLFSFYLHSGTSAIIGYNLGRFHFGRASRTQLVLGISAAIGLHLAYNLTTYASRAPLAGVTTFLLSLFISLQIFILYRKAVFQEFALRHYGRARRQTILLQASPGAGQS